MGKFDSNKGRSGARGDKKPARGAAGKDAKAGEYKAKRSFTKNKSFREGKDTDAERPGKSFETRGDRQYERPFKKTYGTGADKPKRSFGGDSERKPFKKDADGDKPRRTSAGSADRKPFRRDADAAERPRRNFSDADASEKPRRSAAGADDRKPFKRGADAEERPRRSAGASEERKPYKRDADSAEKPRRSAAGSEERKPYKKRSDDAPKRDADEKPRRRSSRDAEESEGPKRVKFDDFEEGKVFSNTRKKEDYNFKPKAKPAAKPKASADGLIRLNKYLSNAGIASRRDADNLILSGVVKVNGVVVDQLGSKISPTDKVTYADATVRSERKVYLLLNKPKDYITTVDDPQERKTVMELIKGACRERVYPVGRLDRNTTGLLLFTNDGELTTKLTHPKFNIKKVYHVSLNKGLKPDDFAAISEGIELEDGFVKADDVAFVGEGKKEIGIEIHSGRNRIVRRIFEHLGYDVLKLDRVVFAGLTKKDLPRGKHRFLTAKEIGFLQMIG